MSPTTVYILVGGGLLLIILLTIGIVVSSSSERKLMEQRLGQYLDDGAKSDADQQAEKAALTEWVSKRVAKTSYGERVARELARADLKFKIAEYFALIVISIFLFGMIAFFLGGGFKGGGASLISFLIGAVIGFFAPRTYVKSQQSKRLVRFNDQLSDMLNLMVNGLRAGYSTMQALEAVSKELPDPISSEFRRVIQEMQIGIPMEAALDNLLRRIPSENLDFVITAINVQREVGGNLSEILDSISFTIRERVRIKGEIRVLTSQVRASGTLLSIIPLCLTVVLWFINRDYLGTLLDPRAPAYPYCAPAVGFVVLFLITSGYLIMMKIADIEV
jgi:tight adherence protein B